MKFGDNLRKLRKLKKISQEELADKVGVSRQSVSKWETGEAYPEMNNILILCKIFRCNINDLVNDSLIDMNSLDEEVQMSIVKFKKEKQQKIKLLSKAIMIISKIGRIGLYVCIPIIILTMIFTPYVIHHVDVEDDKIIMKEPVSGIQIIEEENKLSLEFKNFILADERDEDSINTIKEVLSNHSKKEIIYYVESGFVFLGVSIIILTMILRALEKLFNNINECDTPFTLENVKYIKKIAYLMIAMIILPSIGGSINELLLKEDLNVDFEMFDFIQILFLFSMAYIFEYGYEIQLDSRGKIYGEENE